MTQSLTPVLYLINVNLPYAGHPIAENLLRTQNTIAPGIMYHVQTSKHRHLQGHRRYRLMSFMLQSISRLSRFLFLLRL
jgi:hypothetical protein